MKNYIFAGAMTLATTIGAQAETLVLDFNDTLTGTNVFLGANFIANDLRVVGGDCFRPMSGSPCAALNTGETTVITRYDGAAFDVLSYWYQLRDINAIFEVTARAVDGAIVGTKTFEASVDGFENGGETIYADYTDVTSLTFDNVSVLPGTGRFDQISVEFQGPSPVPVPAAGLMLLTALGGAIALRRKG